MGGRGRGEGVSAGASKIGEGMGGPADPQSTKSVRSGRKPPATWAEAAATAEDRPPAKSAASSSDDRFRLPGLGTRLRAQRLAAHMSLRHLSLTRWVAASFVSQI